MLCSDWSTGLDSLVELNQANCVRGLDYNYVSFHEEENIKTSVLVFLLSPKEKELTVGILYKSLVVGEWIRDPHWYE